MGKLKNVIIQTLSISALLFVSCNTKSSKETNSGKIDSSLITRSRFAILNQDSINYEVFKNGQPTKLSQHDLNEIDRILEDCISAYNIDQKEIYNERKSQNPDLSIKLNSFIIDLKNYQRQYVAVKNEKGEKEVWVNCFCGSGPIPRKYPVLVCDGGNCFFNLKINLTTRKYYEFIVNGYA
jgi:hypothetical protein